MVIDFYVSGIANNTTGTGSCSVVAYLNGEQLVIDSIPIQFSKRFENTTNMKMMQIAVIGALKCYKSGDMIIHISNDWVAKANDWIKIAKKKKSNNLVLSGNDELWLDIDALLEKHDGMVKIELATSDQEGAKYALKLARAIL